MTGLTRLTIAEARDGLRRREFSARELAEAHTLAVEEARPLNAMVLETADRALDMADASDGRLAAGEGGALEGIPLAVKDLFCTEGVRTTAASRILDGFVPPYESTVTARLWKAGAVMLGKANMDEFAMGSSCENSYFGPTLNPCDPERVPGGSSGGSAAAVAADETILALGSDTGGSVRQPASYCGVVGLKPTYGRVSRYGLIAYASSLDQIGPVTKDVEDAALLLQAIAGHDPRDSTSSTAPVPDYRAALKGTICGLKVGLAREHFPAALDSEVAVTAQDAANALVDAGAELVEVQLPVAGHPEYCISTYYIIAMAEASANLARYDGVKYGYRAEGSADLQAMYLQTRSEGFGAEVQRRIMLGTYALSAGYYDAYYRKAQQVRTLIREDFARAFTSCDVLISPVAPTTAFRLGEQLDDPLQMYLNDIYTASVNLAGIPAISVPFAHNRAALPIGVQLLAPPLKEARLLRTAHALERAAA